MPAAKTEQNTKLIVKVQTGVSETGQVKYGQRNFTSINPAVSDDGLLAVGKSLGALQSHAVGSVMRQDTCTLSEE